ncbi:MAG: hypothetical protein LBH44_11835 [Treponema sp.]|jgi:hypothetical protein|nr:hypothetical protein [Treponema sp.]
MTDNYTHFDPSDFGEVPNIQAELLKKKPKKTVTAGTERPPLTLVKMPDTVNKTPRRKVS